MLISSGSLISVFLLSISNKSSGESSVPIVPTKLKVAKMSGEGASKFPRIIRSLNDENEHNNNGNSDANKKIFRPDLVVHFDINETCLIGDDAGGDTREDCLNKIIAKSAFVKMPQGTGSSDLGKSMDDTDTLVPTEWWDGTPISSDAPSTSQQPPPLYTGWDWPKDCCPYYRTAFKKRSKRFVHTDGKPYYDLYKQLEDNVSTKYEKDDTLPEILSHMIPALFTTLKTLADSPQNVRFVFRTYGSDLPEIAKAVTAFASGKHPAHPNFKNEHLLLNQTNIFRGRWTEDGKLYQLWNHDLTEVLASGDKAIMQFLSDKPMCGVQDDYIFWRDNHYEPWAGKPVWVPSSRNVHHVLFDDNIHNLEHDSIASVKKQLSPEGNFETLPGSEILKYQGIHLIRVPTVEPVLNENWFVEQLEKAQEKFAQME